MRSPSSRFAVAAMASVYSPPQMEHGMSAQMIAQTIRAEFDALLEGLSAVVVDDESVITDAVHALRSPQDPHGPLDAVEGGSSIGLDLGFAVKPLTVSEFWRTLATDPASVSAALRVLIRLCTEYRNKLEKVMHAVEAGKALPAQPHPVRLQIATESLVQSIKVITALYATPSCVADDAGKLERAISDWRQELEGRSLGKRTIVLPGETLACGMLERRALAGDDSLRLLVLDAVLTNAGAGPILSPPSSDTGKRALFAPSQDPWALPMILAECSLGFRSEVVWDTCVALLLQLPSLKPSHPPLALSVARSVILLLTRVLHSSPVPDPGLLLEALPPVAALILSSPQPLSGEAAALAAMVEAEVAAPGFCFRRAIARTIPSIFVGAVTDVPAPVLASRPDLLGVQAGHIMDDATTEAAAVDAITLWSTAHRELPVAVASWDPIASSLSATCLAQVHVNDQWGRSFSPGKSGGAADGDEEDPTRGLPGWHPLPLAPPPSDASLSQAPARINVILATLLADLAIDTPAVLQALEGSDQVDLAIWCGRAVDIADAFLTASDSSESPLHTALDLHRQRIPSLLQLLGEILQGTSFETPREEGGGHHHALDVEEMVANSSRGTLIRTDSGTLCTASDSAPLESESDSEEDEVYETSDVVQAMLATNAFPAAWALPSTAASKDTVLRLFSDDSLLARVRRVVKGESRWFCHSNSASAHRRSEWKRQVEAAVSEKGVVPDPNHEEPAPLWIGGVGARVPNHVMSFWPSLADGVELTAMSQVDLRAPIAPGPSPPRSADSLEEPSSLSKKTSNDDGPPADRPNSLARALQAEVAPVTATTIPIGWHSQHSFSPADVPLVRKLVNQCDALQAVDRLHFDLAIDHDIDQESQEQTSDVATPRAEAGEEEEGVKRRDVQRPPRPPVDVPIVVMGGNSVLSSVIAAISTARKERGTSLRRVRPRLYLIPSPPTPPSVPPSHSVGTLPAVVGLSSKGLVPTSADDHATQEMLGDLFRGDLLHHLVGDPPDEGAQELASRLAEQLRGDGVTLVSRWGGESSALLSPGADSASRGIHGWVGPCVPSPESSSLRIARACRTGSTLATWMAATDPWYRRFVFGPFHGDCVVLPRQIHPILPPALGGISLSQRMEAELRALSSKPKEMDSSGLTIPRCLRVSAGALTADTPTHANGLTSLLQEYVRMARRSVPLRVFMVEIWPALPPTGSAAAAATASASSSSTSVVSPDPLVLVMTASLEIGVFANIAWKQAEVESVRAHAAALIACGDVLASSGSMSKTSSSRSMDASSQRSRRGSVGGPVVTTPLESVPTPVMAEPPGPRRHTPPRAWDPAMADKMCPTWASVVHDPKFFRGGGLATCPLTIAASLAVPAGRAGSTGEPPEVPSRDVDAAERASKALARLDSERGGPLDGGTGPGGLVSGPGARVTLVADEAIGVMRLVSIPDADDMAEAETRRHEQEDEGISNPSSDSAADTARGERNLHLLGRALGPVHTRPASFGRPHPLSTMGVAGGPWGISSGIGGPSAVGGPHFASTAPWVAPPNALASPSEPWMLCKAVPASLTQNRMRRWTDASSLRQAIQESSAAADAAGTRDALVAALDIRVSSSPKGTLNGWSNNWATGANGFPVLVDGALAPILARRVRVVPHPNVPVVDVMHFV
jgi:GGDEF domain-containing protein